MKHLSHRVAITLLLSLSPAAWADRREIYLSAELAPSYMTVLDVAYAKRKSRLGLNAQVAALYGITNELHVGLSARVFHGGDFMYRFKENEFRLGDGSSPAGVFHQSVSGYGLAAVASWRHDTGEHWAPFIRGELGLVEIRYNNLNYYADETQGVMPFGTKSELRPSVRLMVGWEYRFGDNWVAAIAISARHGLRALTVLELEIPVSLAYVW